MNHEITLHVVAAVWFSIMIVVMIIINDDSITIIPPTINILTTTSSTRIKLIQAQCSINAFSNLHLIKDNDYLTNVLSRGVGGDVGGGHHGEGVDEDKEQLDGREEDHLEER